MDKRLVKRHKRQVSRARARVGTSEPDVRTPDQLGDAREASRSVTLRRNDPHALYSNPVRNEGAASRVAKLDG
jgi:hypothetical protein